MIEEKVNSYGQKQIINSSDKIIKIGDRYLEVRLIETEKWCGFGNHGTKGMTKPMPRARFVDPNEDSRIHYMVERDHLIKLKKNQKKK